ncbi:MAG: hypothetical protein ACI814_005007 [Mariniblastus sp.]|jgi:hypothetical protein
MLYVDFGVGTGDLTVSDAQSQSLGGPQIFGAGHTLESLQTTIANSELDLNFDLTLDQTDSDAFIAQVMENLNEIFEVFDVTVQQVNSSDFADITAKLAEQSTNDAYILVGGANPIESVDFGASVIDVGNTVDNLGFVFAKEVFDFWPLESGTNVGLNYEVAPLMGWAVARYVAKHVGHTYGLQSTEATNGAAEYDAMRFPGTDANGETLTYGGTRSRYFSDGQPGVFTRYAHDLAAINGITPGVQNSYEALVAAVGTKPDAPYFITGYGQYSNFKTQVSSNATGSLTIHVGDETFEPTLAELQNGLLINTDGSVELGQLLDHNIEIKNAQSLEIHQTLDFGFDGTPDRNIFRSRLEIVPVNRTIYFGTINNNISYENVTILIGDDGDDIFRFYETINVEGIEENQGIFQSEITLANDFALGRDGNDIFIVNRQVKALSGGDGDDFYRNDGGVANRYLGGDGFDIVEYTTGNDWNFQILRILGDSFFELAGPVIPTDRQIERYSFNEGSSARVENLTADSLMGDQSLTWVHYGNRTVVSDVLTGVRMEFVGQMREIVAGPKDFVFIRATAHDLKVSGPGYIQFSSEFDPTLGHTDNIQHRVNLEIASQGRLVIGAKAGNGTQALVTDKFLSGLTGNMIVFDSHQPDVIVHGSDTASDFIAIASSTSRFALFGYGGDDFFTVGYAYGGEAELNRVQGNVVLDGGGGNDLVLIRDTDSTIVRIANRYVSKDQGSGLPRFGIMRYDNFETFRANVHNAPGKFYIAFIWGSPNTTYQYYLTYKTPSITAQPRTDELVLIGGNPDDSRVFIPAVEPQSEQGEFRGGAWVFADARKPIFINRLNELI